MPASDPFDIPVLGSLPPDQAEAKLRELGETAAADAIRAAPISKSFSLGPASWWPFSFSSSRLAEASACKRTVPRISARREDCSTARV